MPLRLRLFQQLDPFLQTGKAMRRRFEQSKRVEKGVWLPVGCRIFDTTIDESDEIVRVTLVKLDLGQIEKAPRTVVRRVLIGLRSAHKFSALQRPPVSAGQIQLLVPEGAQLDLIEQRVGMVAGHFARPDIALPRLIVPFGPFEHAAQRRLGVEIAVVQLGGASQVWLVPTEVRLPNRLPTLDLGGGDFSSCP